MGFTTSEFVYTHHSSYPTPTPARLRADLLSLLQDHEAMCTLNPLVTETRILPHSNDISPSATPSPQLTAHLTSWPEAKQPQWTETRSISEQIANPLLFGLSTMTVVATASFCDTPNGMRSLVTAGAGVRIRGEWRILDELNAAGEVVLEETAHVVASVFVAAFVKGSLKSSHQTLHERLGERLRERIQMRERDGGGGGGGMQQNRI